MLVRVRLDPDRLDEQRSRPASDCDGELSSSRRTRFGRRDRVQADVGRDPVEPRPQRPRALEAVESAPGPEQRLLERVLGVLQRAEHPVAVRVQLPAVRVDERAEGLAVPSAGRLEHARVGSVSDDQGEAPLARARAPHSVDCGGAGEPGALSSPAGGRSAATGR